MKQRLDHWIEDLWGDSATFLRMLWRFWGQSSADLIVELGLIYW